MGAFQVHILVQDSSNVGLGTFHRYPSDAKADDRDVVMKSGAASRERRVEDEGDDERDASRDHCGIADMGKGDDLDVKNYGG